MTLRPGIRLGPYQIGEPVGAGGMGEVYRARDTRLDRTVAIKVLSQHLSSRPDLKERFEREARTISSFSHPHICALYDIGSQDGVDYLVMEYLQGQTLADRLEKSALPLAEALGVAMQVADGLDRAHRQGVVHRDLKPGNIMLTASGAKLLDFGLAKQAQPVATIGSSIVATEAVRPMTAEGTILGTVQYMAPEQLEGGEADARTDIFAFGTVLYEMLTGRRAFEGKSTVSLIAAIVDHDPPPVSSLTPLSPPLLDHLVKTCLAKNPDKRWQSAADVLLQLRLIADGGGQIVVAAGSATRTRLAWGVAAVAGLLAAVAIGFALRAPAATPAAPALRYDLIAPVSNSANQIAVSPAGDYLVTQVAGNAGNLWLRPMDQPDGRILSGTEGGLWPFWSPDGRAVGFFADGKLKRVALRGTAPQTLADADSGTGGTWSGDDIVFAPERNGPLWTVRADGTAARALTSLDAARDEVAHRHPYFLADGRHFIYVGVSRRAERSGIFLASLDEPRGTLLVNSLFRAAVTRQGLLLFVADTTLMSQRLDVDGKRVLGDAVAVAQGVGTNAPNSAAGFSVAMTGVLVFRDTGTDAVFERALSWVDRDGRVTPVTAVREEYEDVTLSPDGSRVAFSLAVRTESGGRLSSDIWTLDVQRGTRTRFTTHRDEDQTPIWTPDGTRIVFRSNRENNSDLYVKNASGVLPEEVLLSSDETKSPEDWSADGRRLLFIETTAQNRLDLRVLSLDGKQIAPVVQTPFQDRGGRFSPDGQWIAYQSDESGQMEVYVLGFPVAASRTLVSSAGGVRPEWRRDGRELYFLQPVSDGKAEMTAVDVTASAGALKLGLPRRLFETVMPQSYEVAADGRFLMVLPVEGGNNGGRGLIRVLVNWERPPAP
jgi:tRNA A-37 threonylcarbamoyl transferase component Bud32